MTAPEKTTPPRCAFAERLVAIAAALRQQAGIHEVELRLGKAGAKATLTSLEKSVVHLPPALRTLYAAHDGLRLSWQEAGTRVPGADVRFVYGHIEILPMMDAFYRDWGNRLGFSSGDAGRGWLHGLVPRVKAFDSPELGQQSRVVGLEVPPRPKRGQPLAPARRLWFVNTVGPSFPLALDDEGYLAEALVFCGLTGWQNLFADLDGGPDHEIREAERRWIARDAAEALADARRLFPSHFVDERHEGKLEALRRASA